MLADCTRRNPNRPAKAAVGPRDPLFWPVSSLRWSPLCSTITLALQSPQVEVTDGKLTLQGGDGTYNQKCFYASAITFKKVKTTLPSTWLPVYDTPWWNKAVPRVPIGLVTIRAPDAPGYPYPRSTLVSRHRTSSMLGRGRVQLRLWFGFGPGWETSNCGSCSLAWFGRVCAVLGC